MRVKRINTGLGQRTTKYVIAICEIMGENFMPGQKIQELAEKIREFIDTRSWSKYHKPKNIAIAISVEAAELLELFQWRASNDEFDKEDYEKIRMETADVAIYAICMANACNFDLGDAIDEKIEQNVRKYPTEDSKDLFDR